MLKSVDILIGLSVVMLVVSMSVTLITQMVTSTLNTRGGHLLRGLTNLLQQLDPALTADISKQISATVLKHPLVSDVGKRLATVVGREEFTKLLLDLASENGPQSLEPIALKALKEAMKNNGIPDPEGTLDSIRSLALTLEKTNPELANDVRLNMAIMSEASSQFVAKLHGWFDQTMDRVSNRFTSSTRVITILAALAVAGAIQLDAIALINRLSTDTMLRESLVDQGKSAIPSQTSDIPAAQSQAQAGQIKSDTSQKSAGATPAQVTDNLASKESKSDSTNSGQAVNGTGVKSGEGGQSPKSDTNNPPAPSGVVSAVDAILGSTGLISAPNWNWQSMTWQKVLGILLSAFLLSLGAPFWYDTLKSALQLRGTLADKEDSQRLVRQTTQPAADDPLTTAAPGLTTSTGALAGERGNLAAIG